LKLGDLVRIVTDAPRPWGGQMGIVTKQRYYFNRTSRVIVYIFKLKETVPMSTDKLILISEAK
jgi:hypothetical protein